MMHDPLMVLGLDIRVARGSLPDLRSSGGRRRVLASTAPESASGNAAPGTGAPQLRHRRGQDLGQLGQVGQDDGDPPTIRRTGRFLYLRLRRHDYSAAEVGAWAARLEPFLTAGDDAYVFFRHDEVGRGPELARALAEAVAERRS
jgi:uncharacterized protein YecE (DUF72 family)